MTSHRPKKIRRSLADLGELLQGKEKLPQHREENEKTTEPSAPLSGDQESDLFTEAMADVTPLDADVSNVYCQIPRKSRRGRPISKEEATEIAALRRLVENGEGFRVEDTPEYMEASEPGVDPALTRRLRHGHYAVQDHLDLHGLTRKEAGEVLTRFFHNALSSGKRMVLVIHGRGLTSPGEPVLKNLVYAWLTKGPFRRYILAFTSARACDGGAGATYVLLRRNPRRKKKKSRAVR
jgi:DNA-nicking Smr family endonuclease